MTNESVGGKFIGKDEKRMVSEEEMKYVSRSLVESKNWPCMGANCVAPVRNENNLQKLCFQLILNLIGANKVRIVPPHSSATFIFSNSVNHPKIDFSFKLPSTFFWLKQQPKESAYCNIPDSTRVTFTLSYLIVILRD